MWLGTFLAILAFIFFILKSVLSWLYQIRNNPRGPLPIPWYGNRMPKDVHPGLCKWYEQMRAKYGNIFTVYQGSQPTIIGEYFAI